MKQYDTESCLILTKRALAGNCFDVTVRAETVAPKAKPGQFAHIRVPGKLLRRPISICGIGADTLRFVFQVRGEGTEILSHLEPGDTMDLLAPLGNGFPMAQGAKCAAFVGGGIGTPPLLGAAAAFSGQKLAVLGFRSKDAVILEDDFRAAGCQTHVTTDDGSYGTPGLVTAVLERESFDVCYACGPAPMLRAVAALCAARGVPCFVSLEERMACGVGACLGCAVALRHADGTEYYGHVCKDGPVFCAQDVVFA